MQLGEFFARVLPDDGEKFFGASVDKTNSFSESRFNDVQSLIKFADNNKQRPVDLYYATGSYSADRKADQTQYKRCFYLDLDCGPGKAYASKRDALKDLDRFKKATSIPMPTIIVDSGNGIHLYWTLSANISASQWKLTANALKMLCTQHGFKADPSITADAARILRVPGSLNCKNPQILKPTSILKGDGTTDIDYDAFRASLGLQPSKLTGVSAVFAGDAADLTDNTNWGNKPIYRADTMVKRCLVFKESLRTGGAGQSEELWKDQLLVLAHAVGGEDYVHKISEKYAGYSKRETDYKYQEQVNKIGSVGPTLCATFETMCPNQCKNCEWRGQQTSPLLTGVPASTNQAPPTYELRPNSVVKMSITEVSKPPVAVTVCEFGIRNFTVSKADNREVAVKFDAVIANVPHSVQLLFSEIADKRAIMGALSRQGCVIQDSYYKEFRNLMTSWITQIQSAKQQMSTFPHMGWVSANGKRGFALGNLTMWANGDESENQLEDPIVSAQFSATGDANEWLSVSHEITQQNKPALNAMIATSFAAPLLQLIGQEGFFMSFTSAASGSGKSTAMRIAQAVWGDPQRGISMLDDTALSVVKRLGYLHNLPAYWDEVRIKNNAGPFVSLLFQLTLGKERSRLSSGAKLQEMGTWATMLVIATNDSIVDHVRAEAKSTDAGRARIFEVEVSELDKPDFEIANRISRLKDNYGHAGVIYARYLVDNYEEVTTKLVEITNALIKMLSPKPAERYWIAGAAAILVGAIFANRLKLTKIDLAGLAQWLKEQVRRQRKSLDEDFKTAPKQADDHVWDYVAEFRDQIVVVDNLTGRGQSTLGKIYFTPPRGRVVGTYAKATGTLRIERTPFIQWLYEHGITPSQVVDTLLKERRARQTLSFVALGMNHPQNRVRALEIRRVSAKLVNGATDDSSSPSPDEISDG